MKKFCDNLQKSKTCQKLLEVTQTTCAQEVKYIRIVKKLI